MSRTTPLPPHSAPPDFDLDTATTVGKKRNTLVACDVYTRNKKRWKREMGILNLKTQPNIKFAPYDKGKRQVITTH